jgi:acetyltransferase-like isoleucine patch superfamily enzyme
MVDRLDRRTMTSPDPVPPLLSARAIRLAAQTPWKVFNELSRLWLLPRARLYFALVGVAWGRGWRLYGLPIIQKYHPSVLTIGDGAEMRSTPRSNPLGPAHPVLLSTRRANARLVIGAQFGITGGTICAEESITIGDRVIVGANTTIRTDFTRSIRQRQKNPLAGQRAVVIGDDEHGMAT